MQWSKYCLLVPTMSPTGFVIRSNVTRKRMYIFVHTNRHKNGEQYCSPLILSAFYYQTIADNFLDCLFYGFYCIFTKFAIKFINSYLFLYPVVFDFTCNISSKQSSDMTWYIFVSRIWYPPIISVHISKI